MSARVVLGVSGASGAPLALAVAAGLERRGCLTDLVITPMAERTLHEEVGADARQRLESLAACVHDNRNLGATIASGSAPARGMIVAPCSMRSLAAIAHGLDDSLLARSAAVQLKERRPLVLLTREAPLTLAHIRNMAAVTEMGGIILPPVPAYYLRPASVEAMTRQIAERAIDLLRLMPPQADAWQGSTAAAGKKPA